MERSPSAFMWIGIVLICIAILGGAFFFISLSSAKQASSQSVILHLPQEAVHNEPSFARLLDGMHMADASSTSFAPYAVMVENSMDAWPLSGPAEANVVYEAPVEGSITRFMLLFDPSATTTHIGPVRSARPYFVEWANALGAMYVHVGGSPDALDLIQSLNGFHDLNQFWHGNDFWRSTSRYAPHNVYTSMEKLHAAAEKQEIDSASFQPWSFADSARAETVSSTEITIPYQGVYQAQWTYVSSTGMYVRRQGRALQLDADGMQVETKNVVVMLVETRVLDAYGRLELRTTGTGKAMLFRDGTVQKGVWRRAKGEHIHFETDDGRDMIFAPGKIWISAVEDPVGFSEINK